MDRLTAMVIFVRAAESGSFSAAASQLGLSSQMVGKRVKQIESDFGTRLLNRSTRTQSLTDAGQLYYEQCKLVLAQVEAADAILAAYGDTPRGTLRITAPPAFSSYHLVPLLPKFMEKFPNIQIALTVMDSRVNLIDEGYDVVFWIGDLPNSTLNVRTLAPYRYICCATPEYLERYGTPTTPDDLKKHRCLHNSVTPMPSQVFWRFRQAGRVYEVPIAGPLRISDERVLMDAVLTGAGISVGCKTRLMRHVNEGRLVRLLADYEIPSLPINVLFAAKTDMPQKIRRFVDWIVVESEERSRSNRLATA